MNPEHRTLLPKMAFTGFASRYREPRLEEGFEDMTEVEFKVSKQSIHTLMRAFPPQRTTINDVPLRQETGRQC